MGGWALLRRHWLVWTLFFFSNGMLPLVNTIEGSFARSLVDCGDIAVDQAPGSLFSGSAHCGDRLRVINEGQVLSSFAASLEGAAKISMMLGAAVCIDMYGRRNILLAGLSCTALSVLLFVLACLFGRWARALFVAGQALQGAFPVELLFEQVASDIAAPLPRAEALRVFELQGVVTFLPVVIFGFVASLIQTLELTDYTLLWCAVLAANTGLLASAALQFPETRAGGPSASAHAGLVAGMKHELMEYVGVFSDLRVLGRVELVLAYLALTAISSGRFAILIFSYSMSYYDMSATQVILCALPIIFIHTACAPLVGMLCRAVGMRRGFVWVCAYKAIAQCLFLLQPRWAWAWFLQYYLSSLVSGWDALTKTLSTTLFKERVSKYMALSTLCKHAANVIGAPMYAWAFDAKATAYGARLLPGFLSFAAYALGMAVLFHPSTGVWRFFATGLDVMQAEQDQKKRADPGKKAD